MGTRNWTTTTTTTTALPLLRVMKTTIEDFPRYTAHHNKSGSQ
jgi:hypothetical protein